MWNTPTSEQLEKIPKLYETEAIPIKEKIVHAHFFYGSSDWWAIEFDGKDTFFGYCILNGDTQYAEFGYFTLSELKGVRFGFLEVDFDLYWTPRPISQVKEINDILEGR